MSFENPRSQAESAELLSFEEVLAELQIDEQKLKEWVSQGELPCFRKRNSVQFRRSDVNRLRQQHETEPTIILTDSDQAQQSHSDEALLDSSSDTLISVHEVLNSGRQSGSFEFESSSDSTLAPETDKATVLMPSVTESLGIHDSMPLLSPNETDSLETDALQEWSEESEELSFQAPARGYGRSRPSRRRAFSIAKRPSHALWTTTLLVLILIPLVFMEALLVNDVDQTEAEWIAVGSERIRACVDQCFVAAHD